jgi:hypothetical protein
MAAFGEQAHDQPPHVKSWRRIVRVNISPGSKAAVVVFAALIVRAQVALPLQSPLQPVKKSLPEPAAVSVTFVPVGNDAEHVPGQLIPAGKLVTVPFAPPCEVVVTVSSFPAANVASTLAGALSVSSQLPLPLQSPPQPVKSSLVELAVSVTCVPFGNDAEHVPGQVIPAGALVTVPCAPPCSVRATATVRATPTHVSVIDGAAPVP